MNSEKEYEGLFGLWIENLSKLTREIEGQGKKAVYVAMSRKMPRLIEVMSKKDKHHNELDNLQYISEHVLPYLLRRFDADRQCVVIMDDAVYYGSTINQLTGYINEITTSTPKVCPLVVSEVVGELPHANICRSDDNVIKGKDIPFFTTQSAKELICLRRPIDVEFPIVRFELSEDVDMKGKPEEILGRCFDNVDVYTVNHQVWVENKGEDIQNFNVLPTEESAFHRWNKDFCKMRFYVSPKELQVIAYAPGFLSEDALSDSRPLFSDDRIQKMWAAVQTCETAAWPENGDEDSFKKRIRESYELQCARSKVVWANYLASFLYLLKQKENVLKAVKELYGLNALNVARISKEDTRLLLPPELVSPITDLLNSILKDNSSETGVFYGTHSEVVANEELIPAEFREDYLERKRQGLQRCSAANEALSHIFSNQNFFINNGKLGNDYLQRTQRLRFGITYTTLVKDLAFPVGIKGLWNAVHQWIDKNIDEGTVKPKYERVQMDGNAYWLRMFRSGENEESYTKMRRLCEFVIGKLRQKEYRNYVECQVVEDLLALAWEDPCRIVNHSYKWDSFVVRDDERPNFSLSYQTEKGMRNFLDYLVTQGYLLALQDSAGIARVSKIDEYDVDTSLSSEQERAVSDYVDAYYFYRKRHNQSLIMNNFFPQADFEHEHLMLAQWIRDFDEYMSKSAFSEESQDLKLQAFAGHDKALNRLIRRVVKADASAVEDLENENRRIIREWLQKETGEERIRLRHSLLAAMVVKEIFSHIFLTPESEEKEKSTATLESYLGYIGDEDENGVVLDFLRMNEDDRVRKENREEVVRALRDTLKKQIL